MKKISEIKEYVKFSNIIKEGYLFFLFVGIFFLTRQIVFPGASSIALVSLIGAFVFAAKPIFETYNSFSKMEKNIFLGYYVFMTIMLVYSLIIEKNSIYYAIHTYGTCILLITAYLYPKNKKIANIFIWVMLLHAVILILIEIFMIINHTEAFSASVRRFIQSNGFGDLYTRNGIYFRVIIRGNELLLVAFMMLFNQKSVSSWVKRAILLVGIFISGNLAYFLALGIFIFLKIVFVDKNYKPLIGIAVVALIIFAIFNKPIIDFVEKGFALKMETSFPTRFDQIDVLVKDMKEPYEVILGKGMGNTITAKTQYRDYTGDRYFELQVFYFYNQLGIIGFSIFIAIHLWLSIKFLKNRFTWVVYISYIAYAVTNPYVFNLIHLVIIIALISLDKIVNEENQVQYKS